MSERNDFSEVAASLGLSNQRAQVALAALHRPLVNLLDGAEDFALFRWLGFCEQCLGKQCALGFLTKDALDTQKICEAVTKNVAVRSPTGDFLVNQMRTGSLDAVIVYESNATFVKDVLDVVPIKMDQKFATQPVAVGKTTKYKYLTQRLIEMLRSPKSGERFKANGFQWLADQK